MPDLLPRMPPKGPLTPERRQSPRHPVRPTEYIEIGDSNGGIILDVSEGGMAVASAHALVGNQTLLFRFQLPRSLEIIEAFGEINWIGETKKRAGVRFVDLPPAAREQIQKWIDSQISGRFDDDQKPNISAVSSPTIPQGIPHHEPSYHELAEEETDVAHGHNSKNLNPFSSTLSGPLDEPEIDESEPAEEEKTTADSDDQPPPERRIQSRLPMTASTYVQLSNGNGGLMANLSKTGFCVRAAKTLETDELPVVRFQLPNAPDFVESSAWIVWKSPSRKTVGARFESLSDEAQSQIAQWIDSQPLPKNASVKNPLSKDPQNPAASSPSERRQKISPAPKTPAPVIPVPVTLMSPDSVPIPAYISPLAISLDAQPAVPSANNSSFTPSRAKTPSIAPSGKPSLPSTGKTLAQVPRVSSAPSSAKPAPHSQKPLAAPRSKPLAPAASSTNAPNLHSPLPIEPSPHIPRGLKNSWDQFAAPPPTGPFVPPVFKEPDWSVAPKRPTGYWKTVAMIVVIVGALLGAATLLRSKKSVTPPSQETAQNSAAESAPITPSTDPAADSSVANSAPTSQPTPSVTTPRSNSAPSREFSDAPRYITPPKGLPKGDKQFVDEPRPPRSQAQMSSSPTQSNNASSRTASDQPSSSEPGAIQSDERPTEESAGFPTVVRRVQTSPPPASSNANDQAAATPGSASPPPAPVASRDQQSGTNLASATGMMQNSSSSAQPPSSENNSSPRPASASINPAAATTTAATVLKAAPSVTVFSRFRSIRNISGTPRAAGSDLQIGRLKSGPTPPYPSEAQRQQIQGTVELDVLVGADGSILTVHLVKGPPELASVAMGTVRSWQYGQTTLGGHPVETDQSIYFTFKLTK
jgi:hypothetical protein